jgi:DNA-binding transcriptional LysR family regulator
MGHLRIGDAGVATTDVLAPAVRTLRKEWSNLRLTFYQNTSQGFFDDKIDCAFTLLAPTDGELTSHRLMTLEISTTAGHCTSCRRDRCRHTGGIGQISLYRRYHLPSTDSAGPKDHLLCCPPPYDSSELLHALVELCRKQAKEVFL